MVKPNKWFVVCDNCGSISWLVEGVEKNDIDELTSKGDSKSVMWEEDEKLVGVYCESCEKILKPILFKEINKAWRIKIFNMTTDERILWVKSYLIIKQMEKENEKSKK